MMQATGEPQWSTSSKENGGKMYRKKIFIFAICSMFFILGCQKNEPKSTKKETVKTEQKSKPTKKQGYIYGTVKETMNSGGYTYILLEFDGKKSWVAVPPMDVKVGDEVMLYPGQVMKNFHSKSLNKTFDSIIFSQGAVSPPMSNAHGGEDGAKMVVKAHSSATRLGKKDVKIEPATGPGAITVEMAYKKAKELDGKKVVLKAVVVKVAKNILGKNWLHCQDGTGTEEAGNFDITVTTKAFPSVGDKVIIKGVLHKDRDIGAGYFYPVIIEDANITVIK